MRRDENDDGKSLLLLRPCGGPAFRRTLFARNSAALHSDGLTTSRINGLRRTLAELYDARSRVSDTCLCYDVFLSRSLFISSCSIIKPFAD